MHTPSYKKTVSQALLYVIVLALPLVAFRNCWRRKVPPAVALVTVTTTEVGGIVNVGNSCYLNAAMQIIARFYPDASFDGFSKKQDVGKGKYDCLKKKGQEIIKILREKERGVNRKEAQDFYDAFRDVYATGNLFQKKKSESAYEAFVALWGKPLNEKPLLHVLLEINPKEVKMATLLCNDGLSKEISNLKSDTMVISVPRSAPNESENFSMGNETRINTSIQNALSIDGYTLEGFICHQKHILHYTAYIKAEDDEWWCYNDKKVCLVDNQDVSKAAEQGVLYVYKKAAAP